MKRVDKKDVKKVANKIGKVITIALFILMVILIYVISPKITDVIQNGAKYIYELESECITRIVELILGITLPTAVLLTIFKKK